MTDEEFVRYRDDFVALLRLTKRDGIEDLINWLAVKTDFFDAPASTKYHGAYKHGLLQHSMDVYQKLVQLKSISLCPASQYQYDTDESIIIVSLLHDLCKANMYTKTTRNVKTNTGWEVKLCYTVDEIYHFGGHGSKSVYLASRFIRLTPAEAAAINSHMGTSDGNNLVHDVYKQFHLAWYLHVADEAATYLLDKERTINND